MMGTEAVKVACKSQGTVDRIKSLFSLSTVIWISWNAWILLFHIWVSFETGMARWGATTGGSD